MEAMGLGEFCQSIEALDAESRKNNFGAYLKSDQICEFDSRGQIACSISIWPEQHVALLALLTQCGRPIRT